jgi:hypothetical protein
MRKIDFIYFDKMPLKYELLTLSNILLECDVSRTNEHRLHTPI